MLELELLTVDDGIVESAWCEETNKRVNVIRPAMNIGREFRRRLKEIDPLMLHSRELFWPTDLVALALEGPSTSERLRKAAALVGRLASEVTRQQGEKEQTQADSKPDSEKKSMPDSADVRDLCRLLQKGVPTGKTQIEIAREFTGKNNNKAKSLLRQARRFRHLWG